MAHHRYSVRIRRGMPKMERLYKHVLKSELAMGRSLRDAERIAAATVNKARSRRSRRGGVKLVSRGGSRRQWYPRKRRHRR